MDSFILAMIATFVPERAQLLTILASGKLYKEVRNGCTYANGVLHSFQDQPAVDNGWVKIWYRLGKIHRDNDQPAQVYSNGTKKWYQNGLLHREIKPAVMEYDGKWSWHKLGQYSRENNKPTVSYLNVLTNGPNTLIWTDGMGRIHRDNDRPAIINCTGDKEWYQNGQKHRHNDRPALVMQNGEMVWYKRGKIHRAKDKPAVIHPEGEREWYKNGKLHRDNNKPAIVCPNQPPQFWIHGYRVE